MLFMSQVGEVQKLRQKFVFENPQNFPKNWQHSLVALNLCWNLATVVHCA
jgi:hypothetical protein